MFAVVLLWNKYSSWLENVPVVEKSPKEDISVLLGPHMLLVLLVAVNHLLVPVSLMLVFTDFLFFKITAH